MSESKVRQLHPELAAGQLAPEIASRRPLYIFSLAGLIVGLLSDLTYMMVDPRIDFETREV